jgi:hypothetical protein
MNRLVAWAGNPYFAHAMRGLGCDPVVLPPAAKLSWSDILACCGRVPDLFIYGDVSAPPFLQGVEAYPCPTVFYAIDTHIHSWYPLYAQAFDLCCVAMRDHLPLFLNQRLGPRQVRWLPLFSREQDRPMPEAGPVADEVLFVGKNDPDLTPVRYRFLQELARRVPLAVRQGSYPELYARASLVLNVSEHKDLNFRVFEALGCGACLLTPRVGHGLAELFRDGEELFIYDPSAMDDLVGLIEALLADPRRRERVAGQGRAAVLRGHQAMDRARDLCLWMNSMDLEILANARLAAKDQIRAWLRVAYLHFAEAEGNELRARMYLRDFAGSGQPR